MMLALAVLIALACVSGVWAWLGWRQRSPDPDQARPYLHGASAALVLMVLLLGLDNHAPADMPRLIALFLAIATGMLLFLKRQRQQAFPRPLLWLHVAASVGALVLVGAKLV